VVWFIVFLNQDSAMQNISSISSTVKFYAEKPGLVFGIGMVSSVLFSTFMGFLLVRYPVIYFSNWVLLLALSEAAIPILQHISLLTRYTMMFVLVVAGASIFLRNLAWDATQKAGLLLLAWIVLHILDYGMDYETALLVPIQLAMFIGVFFVVPLIFSNESKIRSLCYGLAFAGSILTIVNLIGLVAAPEPFLAGRFKSWYALPTSFANGYVILLVAVIWAFMDTRRYIVKFIFGGFATVGMILIMLSGTRNAVLALVIAVVLFSYLWKRQYLVYVMVASLGLILTAVAFNFNSEYFGSASERISRVSSDETRFTVWEHAWMYIQQKPFWGYGLAADLKAFDKALPVWARFDPHNVYLGYWLRLGLIGLLLITFMSVLNLMRSIKFIYARREVGMDVSCVVLFFAMLACILTMGIFEDNLASRGSALQLIWAMSIAILMKYTSSKA
jgi:O-antigen ligase